jgi:hypothetical protein
MKLRDFYDYVESLLITNSTKADDVIDKIEVFEWAADQERCFIMAFKHETNGEKLMMKLFYPLYTIVVAGEREL